LTKPTSLSNSFYQLYAPLLFSLRKTYFTGYVSGCLCWLKWYSIRGKIIAFPLQLFIS